jgi:Uncharacterized protein conserved in bacteria (DUF2188)
VAFGLCLLGRGKGHAVIHPTITEIEPEGGNRKQVSVGPAHIEAPAVEQARKLAQRNKSELVVHTQDGKIGERRSYGHDQFPPGG